MPVDPDSGAGRFLVDLRNYGGICYEPYPFQQRFHGSPAPYGFLGGAAGPGKQLPLDTPIPTPDGWTPLGGLTVGSEIFDEAGRVCRVTYMSPVDVDPKAIQFSFDDGSKQVCCPDHLWLTWNNAELAAFTRRDESWRARRRATRPTRGVGLKPWTTKLNKERQHVYKEPSGSVRSAAEIAATLRHGKRTNHAVPVAKALQLPSVSLAVDPYVLGAWLGDGDSASGIITGVDGEVFASIAAAGYALKNNREARSGFAPRYRIVGLTAQLSKMGVKSNKHIPAVYLRSSIEQRLALLQGLMDTDGSCDKKSGYCEFCSTSKPLALGVHELALTLGIKAILKEDRAKLRGMDCGPRYRVTFSTDLPVFRIVRKAARLKENRRRTTQFRYITAADVVPSIPMRCIQVDSPSHLYLCGRSMIPTHNTTGSLMELFVSAHEFSEADGPQVHQLILRRTYPQLEATVITRFRELFPKSLYRKFNETKSEVTWRNGSTWKFGSMQYESDAWNFQGQWKDIYYDELCDFMFGQWMATSAWNRCPVSRQTRKWGSGNPIGIGAVWVEDLFVKHVPCMDMDASQRKAYDPADYPYFEATYLDNPVYANDPTFLKNLEAYPEAFRDALKYAIWGAAGGYFRGVFDEAIHVFERHKLEIKPWWKQWISGNWGFTDPYAYYKHCMDDEGVVYTYDELYGKENEPEELAKIICEWAREDGVMPKFENFAHSFDAAKSTRTQTYGENVNSVNNRMIPVLRKAGIPDPHESTRDKLGRDTLMRERMHQRVKLGEDGNGHILEVPNWQMADRCVQLRRLIPVVKADPKEPEKIQYGGGGADSPLQGAGYGLYAIWGKPRMVPKSVQLQKVLADAPDKTAEYLRALRFEKQWTDKHPSRGRNPVRWQRQ